MNETYVYIKNLNYLPYIFKLYFVIQNIYYNIIILRLKYKLL